MKRLELINVSKGKRSYNRKTAEQALINLLNKIKEANQKEEFIYIITKAVLFGSYINTDNEKIGNKDIVLQGIDILQIYME